MFVVDEFQLLKLINKDKGAKEFKAAVQIWMGKGHDLVAPEAPPFDVSWEIDNGLQTNTETFCPPSEKVDRESDNARVWEIFSEKYGAVNQQTDNY